MSAAKLPNHLKLHCPTCGAIIKVPFYRCATYIEVRKCKCGEEWVVKATVLQSDDSMTIHEVEWDRPLRGLFEYLRQG